MDFFERGGLLVHINLREYVMQTSLAIRVTCGSLLDLSQIDSILVTG
jgi:hypothetical protein